MGDLEAQEAEQTEKWEEGEQTEKWEKAAPVKPKQEKQRTRTQKRNTKRKNKADEWTRMQMEERLAKKHKSGKISEVDFQEGMKKIKALESSDEGSDMDSDFDSSDDESKGQPEPGK